LAPAKSIDGASASTVRSMFSAWPCVTHAPFWNARTKMSWALPACCSNVAQGTRAAPASEPPVTSETPAFWLGSMPAAGSSLTWAPFDGSPMNAADAAEAAASTSTIVTAATRADGEAFMRDPPAGRRFRSRRESCGEPMHGLRRGPNALVRRRP
jgi:hypothetical protein